jgi:hypothetical protein
MEGLFPIIIIVAGLISFLSKMKGQNQEDPRRKKTSMPPQLDPMHPKHFETNKPLSKQATTIRKEPEANHLSDIQTFTKEAAPMAAERRDVSDQQNRLRQPEQTNNTSRLKVQNLNKQKLVEGIIMAEVLGSPRGLKPHPSSRLSTKKKLPS